MAFDISSTALISASLLPIILYVFWFLTSTSPSIECGSSALASSARFIPNISSSVPSATNIRGKRIVLLIAHPDDEAMFFGPMLTQLTAPELGNHVKILCLSTGNAENLGETRKKELQDSALHLGIRRNTDVFIVDDPFRFPDSMTKTWSASEIASLLVEAFAPELNKSTSNGSGKKSTSKEEQQPPKATIDVLITFDNHGISSHPNHISLSHGAHLFLRLLMRDKAGWRCPVTLYHLRTISLLRKYSFVLDAPLTLFLGAVSNIVGASGGSRRGSSRMTTERGRKPVRDIVGVNAIAGAGAAAAVGDPVEELRLLFVANPMEYWRVRRAMTSCHKSQMIWFRWGWISLGRYMVVNDLVQGK